MMVRADTTRNASGYPYRDLADAIIMQACDDYRVSLRKISRGTDCRNEEYLISDALVFFGSSWYVELTDIDSDYMVEHLKADVVEQAKADYREAWRGIWLKKKKGAERISRRLEAFFRSERFYKISGVRGPMVIAQQKHEILTEILKECRELMDRDSRDGLERIKGFMCSEKFKELSELDPERLIAGLK